MPFKNFLFMPNRNVSSFSGSIIYLPPVGLGCFYFACRWSHTYLNSFDSFQLLLNSRKSKTLKMIAWSKVSGTSVFVFPWQEHSFYGLFPTHMNVSPSTMCLCSKCAQCNPSAWKPITCIQTENSYQRLQRKKKDWVVWFSAQGDLLLNI